MMTKHQLAELVMRWSGLNYLTRPNENRTARRFIITS